MIYSAFCLQVPPQYNASFLEKKQLQSRPNENKGKQKNADAFDELLFGREIKWIIFIIFKHNLKVKSEKRKVKNEK
jgi:hypothetical protein